MKYQPGDRVRVLRGHWAGEVLPVIRDPLDELSTFCISIDPSDGGKHEWRKREWTILRYLVEPLDAVSALGDLV